MKKIKINTKEPLGLKLVGITVSHYMDLYMANILTPGVKFSLQREPKNKFDPNAISVWLNGLKVGYLSREDALNKSVIKAYAESKQVVLIDPKIHKEADGALRHYVKINLE